MATYILLWNPHRWEWDSFGEFVERTRRGEIPLFDWSTGNRKTVKDGDRLFLFRQHSNRGIIGSGHASGPSYRKPHWDESRDDEQNCIDVLWDTLVVPSEVLPVATLETSNLGISWSTMFGSGIHVADESAERIEQLWAEHLESIGRVRAYHSTPEHLANEVHETFREGAVHRISVNAYERNARARRTCVDHYGLNCSVCGFNFCDTYGDLGADFIHVHHLRDLAAIGSEYEIDPIADLRPVCPNCHAMLHRECPAMSIESLRAMLRN